MAQPQAAAQMELGPTQVIKHHSTNRGSLNSTPDSIIAWKGPGVGLARGPVSSYSFRTARPGGQNLGIVIIVDGLLDKDCPWSKYPFELFPFSFGQ